MAIPKRALCATALTVCSFFSYAGEACVDNFSSTGNVLTGQMYKSGAHLSNTSLSDAFENALQFTSTHGFVVLKSDKNAGTISAAQDTSYKNGVIHPLNIMLKADGANTVMAITFSMKGLSLAASDDIKKHFCTTIAAAGNARSGDMPQAPQASARPAQRRALVGYALIAPEQSKAIEAALMKSIPNDRIRDMVKDAAPAITVMAERVSCLANDTGRSALSEFAAPNKSSFIYLSYPMNVGGGTKYHDKAFCMTVLRVSGWQAPANNVLSYEIIFKADDSGETKSWNHEIVRQSDGSWLFSQ
jgi:hypothetical protein